MEKMTFGWEVGLLNKFIGFTYKKNHYITKFNLRNLQRLIAASDFSMYQTKTQIIKRKMFLENSLRGKLDEGIEDESILLRFATDDIEDPTYQEIIDNLPKYKQLNHAEISYINKLVEDRLLFGNTHNLLTEIDDVKTRINSGEFSSYREANDLLVDWAHKILQEKRRIVSAMNKGVLRFNDDNIIERIDDILAKIGKESNKIKSGMQMLNEALGGGYEGGRLYTYGALPANFKSGLLLKTAIDAIKYNQDLVGKKEGHRKAVVYFTMENFIEESFERAFHMTVSNDSIRDMNSKTIKSKLEKANIIGNQNIELIMVYKPNRSITTLDIRHLIEELDEDGVEVVLLCFDYLKRIRPAEYAATEKEELKNVTNELKTIGMDFDIPIVTAAQLNRQAATTINTLVKQGKQDALKELDPSVVGSAIEIYENTDVLILINMQVRRRDKKKFLGFSVCKQRYYEPETLYFNQPFSEKLFNLEDDINLKKSKGVVNLGSDFDNIDSGEFDPIGYKELCDNVDSATSPVFDATPL